MKRILAAVDRSSHAPAVVGRAVQLASLLHSELAILSVIDSDPMTGKSMGEERDQFARLHRDLILKHFPKNELAVESDTSAGAVYRYEPGGITVRSVILQGNPVDRICGYAEEIGADLVILGNRGIGNIGTLVLGSVSEKVVRKCTQSVMVVKEENLDRSGWESVPGAQKARHRLGTR